MVKKIVKKTQDKQKKRTTATTTTTDGSSSSSSLPKAQTAQQFKDQLAKIEEELASFGVSSKNNHNKNGMNDDDDDSSDNDSSENELQVVKPGQGTKQREAGDAYHQGVRGGGVRKSQRKATGKLNRKKQAKLARALDYQDRKGEEVVKKLVRKVRQVSKH